MSQANGEAFFSAATAYSDWWKQAEGNAAVLPLGQPTAVAAAVKTIKPKVDDYFARCRLAAFDSRALNALNRDEKEFFALASEDLTTNTTEVPALPLARVAAGNPLPLGNRARKPV